MTTIGANIYIKHNTYATRLDGNRLTETMKSHSNQVILQVQTAIYKMVGSLGRKVPDRSNR